MRKLTTEEFIERSKSVHGDKYDYSKTEYKNAQTKVCIICPKHGEFWQQPNNHLNGTGCPACNRTDWTTESFIKRAREIHGDKYDYSKVIYNGTRNKVCIISNEKDRNGNVIGEFWQFPLVHLQGSGCKKEKRGINEDCWEVRTCPVCGKKFKIRKKYKKINCSEECQKKYIEEHKEEINKKKSEKITAFYSKKTKEYWDNIHRKCKQTCLKKYGVDSFSKTELGRKICSENMKKMKHNRDEQVKHNVLIPKYTEICNKDNIELLEFNNRFDCLLKCKKCGNIFRSRVLGYLTETTTTNLCRICHPIIYKDNKFETEFEDFLKELGINYVKNYRGVISPMEIDYFLPEYNIGFELDGIYWHCELYRDENYHLMKTTKCAENNVRLIHIFEDEWKEKKEICQSRIKNIINRTEVRVFARKCQIKEISKNTTKEFLVRNHIQGYCVYKYSYGLYYKGELVSVMTFGKLRKCLGNKTNSNTKNYEMIRFCNKLGVSVIGGASKLFKHFINEHNPDTIISYADRRWSIGNLYKKLGFNCINATKPNYSYLINGERKNRFAFRKHILVEKYGCNKDMTEHDFCLSNKWYRIYDCGSFVFKYNVH